MTKSLLHTSVRFYFTRSLFRMRPKNQKGNIMQAAGQLRNQTSIRFYYMSFSQVVISSKCGDMPALSSSRAMKLCVLIPNSPGNTTVLRSSNAEARARVLLLPLSGPSRRRIRRAAPVAFFSAEEPHLRYGLYS